MKFNVHNINNSYIELYISNFDKSTISSGYMSSYETIKTAYEMVKSASEMIKIFDGEIAEELYNISLKIDNELYFIY